ncbi:glycosyltransferase [Solirubrobacter soli]|uniref:glycosyltransferase n=1 Tax=Solirubrobacter soli TaxID=363832 RepID=UPI00040913E2|nr:glycosyltransferase [Solirubrobacter soli]
MIALLHHRYRHAGGEERAVEDLRWLITTHLGEDVTTLERESDQVGARQAARGLLTGGTRPQDVAEAVKRTGARVVHAHNVHPTFGANALQAARQAGARTVLHLHNYRLVCAVGTCFTGGQDCTRCHGRNTLPGVLHNCRGSRAEALVYAAGLARQQRRLIDAADAIVVPSAFARQRLLDLGAPVDRAEVLGSVQRTFATHSDAHTGEYVLAAGRLTPEKGFADVVEACNRADLPLVVAGEGPERAALEAAAHTARFVGHVTADRLAELRKRAAVAVIPSRYAEILPLAALEAMAAALPTVAAASGGLEEAVPEEGLYPPGDVAALQAVLTARYRDRDAGERALRAARARSAPEVIANRLQALYGPKLRTRG